MIGLFEALKTLDLLIVPMILTPSPGPGNVSVDQ